MCGACARWVSWSTWVTPRRISSKPMRWSIPPPSSPAISNSKKPASSICRWSVARKCWPRSCGSNPASPSPAPTARPRQRRWWRRCSTPAVSIPPSSMAASSTPMAPTRGSVQAIGSWSRRTKATAPSCACPPPSPWSPMPIRTISTTTARSTRCAMPSSDSSRTCRSMVLPCSASIIRRFRRWSAASPIAVS